MPTKPPTHGRRTTRTARDRDYERRRMNDPALRWAKKVRNSARWKKVRAHYYGQHPLCEECRTHGRITKAEQVHHVIGLAKAFHSKDADALAFGYDNLMSVCHPCHRKLEEKGG